MTKIELKIPENVTAEFNRFELHVEGPNGKISKSFRYPGLDVNVQDNSIVIESHFDNKKTNSMLGTFKSHVLNMFHGATLGWTYELVIFYAHFPMQVRAENGLVMIDNFLGERHPRKVIIQGDSNVSIDGEKIYVTGPDKEAVGQTAGSLEQSTMIKNKDPRVFQDGIYITKKSIRGVA
jgi:large subunit ribosomal protein L6